MSTDRDVLERQGRALSRRLAYRQVRWRLALVGFAAQIPMAVWFPYGDHDRESWRWPVVGFTVVQLLILGLVVSRCGASGEEAETRVPRRQKNAWILSFLAVLAIVAFGLGRLDPDSAGTYALSYLAVSYVWTGGLIWAPRPWQWASWVPLVALLWGPAREAPLDFALRYSYVFAVVLLATMSISAYLTRSENELVHQGAEFRPLWEGVSDLLVTELVDAGSHEQSCAHRSPTSRTRFGDELTLLMRRRSYTNQFTEWRARSIFSEHFELDPPHAALVRQVTDRVFANENSPLSILVYPHGDDRARILAKGSLSTVSHDDFINDPTLAPAPDVKVDVDNLAFGKVVRLDVPATQGPVSLDPTDRSGGSRRGRAILDDVVGGGVAGDNYRFGRALLWVMALHPISVILQQWFLDEPPGRESFAGSVALTLCCVAMLGVAGSAIVSVRRDETVVTRTAWHLAVGVLYMLPMLVLAVFDKDGRLWSDSAGAAFRFVHPFAFGSIALSVLLGLWAAHAPLGASLVVKPSDSAPTRRAQSLRLVRRAFRPGEVRSVALTFIVMIPTTAVAVAVAGLHADDLGLTSWLVQTGKWIALPGLGSLAGVFLIRRTFAVLGDHTFAAQRGGEPDEPPGVHLCDTDCTWVGEVNAWRDWASRQPVALGATVAVALALLRVPPPGDVDPKFPELDVSTPLRERELASALAALDRTLLLSGYRCSRIVHQPSEVTIRIDFTPAWRPGVLHWYLLGRSVAHPTSR